MDRKLLFYLLGSVEESFAKFSLRGEVFEKLEGDIRDDIEVVRTSLEDLRRDVAKFYAGLTFYESDSPDPDASME